MNSRGSPEDHGVRNHGGAEQVGAAIEQIRPHVGVTALVDLKGPARIVGELDRDDDGAVGMTTAAGELAARGRSSGQGSTVCAGTKPCSSAISWTMPQSSMLSLKVSPTKIEELVEHRKLRVGRGYWHGGVTGIDTQDLAQPIGRVLHVRPDPSPVLSLTVTDQTCSLSSRSLAFHPSRFPSKGRRSTPPSARETGLYPGRS